MTEADALRQLWQEDSRRLTINPLGKEELMTLLQTRAADVRTRTVRRVRREIRIYLVILLIPVANLVLQYKFSWKAILGTLGVSFFMGLVIAVLAYKEHQLQTLPLMGSLRESILALLSGIDSTTRLYMIAYMICIVIPTAALEAFLFWKHGLTLGQIVALIAGVAFVVWSYFSGRAYLERSFGRYRAELASCLAELDRA